MRLVFALVLVLGVALAGFAVYMAQGFIGQTQAERDRLAAEQANAPRLVDIVVATKLNYGDRSTRDDLEVIKVQEGKVPAGIFAFIIRAGGANLRYSEFKVSYAIAVGGVRSIALIGHNQCGMVNLMARKDIFINGLVDNAGWDREWAEQHFTQFPPMFEIGTKLTLCLVKRNGYD